MRVVFYDYGGSHTSVVAANLLTGRLPGSLPSDDELLALNYFDKTTPQDFGHLHYAGEDNLGNQVYSLGAKSGKYGYVLAALTKLMGAEERFHFRSTMPYLNLHLRIGGFLSRRLNLVFIGRPLVIAGIKKTFNHLQLMVNQTEARLEGQ